MPTVVYLHFSGISHWCFPQDGFGVLVEAEVETRQAFCGGCESADVCIHRTAPLNRSIARPVESLRRHYREGSPHPVNSCSAPDNSTSSKQPPLPSTVGKSDVLNQSTHSLSLCEPRDTTLLFKCNLNSEQHNSSFAAISFVETLFQLTFCLSIKC